MAVIGHGGLFLNGFYRKIFFEGLTGIFSEDNYEGSHFLIKSFLSTILGGCRTIHDPAANPACIVRQPPEDSSLSLFIDWPACWKDSI